jgi:biotin carboxyl carrier protein
VRSIFILAALATTLAARAPAPLVVTARARSIQPGEVVMLTIASTGAVGSVRVHGLNRDYLPFPVDSGTWNVLVGIDLGVTPGTYPILIEAGEGPAPTRATHRLVVKPRKFPTRTLKVDEAFVTPPAEVLERIEREARALTELWKAPPSAKAWAGPFVRPVPEAANSAFGTRSIFNGQPRDPHSGADFRSPAGTPVKAPNAGRVVLASARYFSGNTVVLDHGLSVFSLFAHLSEISVSEGSVVKPGDVVGRVGATGRVTGPHLHWSVRANGARVDPLSLLWVLGSTPNSKVRRAFG